MRAGVRLRNAVQFENVPLEALMAQVLGSWTRVFGLAGDADLRISATIGTRMWFDAAGNLTGFQTRLILRDSPVLVLVHGRVSGPGKLDVAAYVGSTSSDESSLGEPAFHQTIDLPPNALVEDSFTPRGNLRDLRLGQSWTIPVYRPFPPNSPVEIVAVKAERHEVIIYDGADVETLLLVYRMDAGSGIRAAREPVAMEWVDPEGTSPSPGNIGIGSAYAIRSNAAGSCRPADESSESAATSRNLGWPLGQRFGIRPNQRGRGCANGTTSDRARSTMIELRGLVRRFGQKVAVKGLDLDIQAGELFAFLGPNGAGKTTTIKMTVGLLQPTEGVARICGFDVRTQTREANLRTGYVPDQPYLYEKLSGREFLLFVSELYGLPAAQAAENIEQQIATFELAGFVDDLTESYSHGMKQRLVFASALVHQPQVLIVDEPMVGLDPAQHAFGQGPPARKGPERDDGVHVDSHTGHRGRDR